MYRRILLVAVLSIVFVALGVGWVRCYLSPLAEHAARKPGQADDAAEELPSACLEELAMLDAGTSRRTVGWDKLASRERRPTESVPIGGPAPAEARRSHPTDLPEHTDNAAIAPDRLASGSDTARPISAVQSAEWNAPAARLPARAAAARPARTTTLPVSVEEPLPIKSIDTFKAADVLELMRRLRSDSEVERTTAGRELLRRGFSEVDLELARQLFSSDAEVRKQLALAVPRLASVDAARWLMWLAADPQPEVRLAAITTLATTGDPSLLDRVEALARKDSDPRVQAVADQIAKQRELAASRGGKLLR